MTEIVIVSVWGLTTLLCGLVLIDLAGVTAYQGTRRASDRESDDDLG